VAGQALVVGLEWPIVLPIGVLTKITPGIAIGWHLVRRDWHRLIVGLGFTAAFSAISYLLAPSAWTDWFAFLAASPGRSELLVPRLVLGAALVVVGGLTGRRWLVPVAVWISLPVVWVNSWVILLAAIRLRERVPALAPLVAPPPAVAPGAA
jgi:Glycosyltransferase family 87